MVDMKRLGKRKVRMMLDTPRGRAALAKRMVEPIRRALELHAMTFRTVFRFTTAGMHPSTKAKFLRLVRSAYGKEESSSEWTALNKFIATRNLERFLTRP